MNKLAIIAALLIFISIANADTIISSCNNTLNTANEVYVLNQSISSNLLTCIEVNATNVTIDCAGFSISGNNTQLGATAPVAGDTYVYGIYTKKDQTRILNCIIQDEYLAIEIAIAGTNALIQNCTLSSNHTNGAAINADYRAGGLRVINTSASTLYTTTSRVAVGLYPNASTLDCGGKTIATKNGGGVQIGWNRAYANTIIKNCVFENNVGSEAPLVLNNGANVTLTNLLINASQMSDPQSPLSNAAPNVTITNVTIITNATVNAFVSSAQNELYINGITVVNISAAKKFTIGSTTGVVTNISGNYTLTFGSTSKNTTFANSTVPAAITFDGDYNTISNVTANSLSTQSGANYNLVINSKFIAGQCAVGQLNAINNSLCNNTANYGLYLLGNSTAFNNTVFGNGTTLGAVYVGNTYAQFIMNNITGLGATADRNVVQYAAAGGLTTFCLNTFNYNGAGVIINDTKGNNFYNCTYDGKNQGNLYQNVANGSLEVTGTTASSISGYYIGTGGAGYPYNVSTSQGKFVCQNATSNYSGCGDYAPLFPFAAPTDSCTYSGSGNWTINLSDNCNITSSVNLGANYIIYNGTGTVTYKNESSRITLNAKGEILSNIAGIFKQFIQSLLWKNYTG